MARGIISRPNPESGGVSLKRNGFIAEVNSGAVSIAYGSFGGKRQLPLTNRKTNHSPSLPKPIYFKRGRSLPRFLKRVLKESWAVFRNVRI
ncbi:hypothetical protein AVEN_96081-1 [Araneus ventricosus]|uniref:Uncharacterized protein n=1 Tax=Araneus ventricosus TaxID=182803 RepID=A0A4Y2B6C4_ARAVE|nr:hypothetical protein AVEN_96081-1 [Araneus ventricosus]